MNGAGFQVHRITHSFEGLMALSDVTFSLEPGEILGIIGPNGAGKTTLFNIISGFIKPDQGELHYHGREITHLKPHEVVNLGLARTFQIVRPFQGMTVTENTMVAAMCPRARQMRSDDMSVEAWVLDVLERVGLIHRRDDPVSGLPMGDLRRLEIARALATFPDLILLDEPFSGLSLREMAALAGLVRTLHEEECTILIIEHKLKVLMSLARRILALDFGNIIADGTPREIGENEAVIRAYLGRRRHVSGNAED